MKNNSYLEIKVEIYSKRGRSMVEPLKPVKIENLSKEAQKLYDVINKENDLACVLIGASYLEKVLATILERYFIDTKVSAKLLDSLNGALGTFSSRADICYCLGLIPKGFYKNMCTIGEIRNLFAHNHLLLGFSNNEISRLVDSLVFPRAEGIIVENGKSRESKEPFSQFKKNSREKFNVILTLMISHVISIGYQTQHRQRKLKGWE